MLNLDAGPNKLAYDKCSVLSFKGQLYFYLSINNSNGIITSLADLASSDLITIKSPSFSLNENLNQNSFPMTLALIGLYPLTQTSTNTTAFAGSSVTLLSSFITFPNMAFNISSA